MDAKEARDRMVRARLRLEAARKEVAKAQAEEREAHLLWEKTVRDWSAASTPGVES